MVLYDHDSIAGEFHSACQGAEGSGTSVSDKLPERAQNLSQIRTKGNKTYEDRTDGLCRRYFLKYHSEMIFNNAFVIGDVGYLYQGTFPVFVITHK